MNDYLNTIQSQYSASPRIKALIKTFADGIEPDADIDIFYNKVFNVLTAVGKGLDIWGNIVDIGRIIWLEGDNEYFGFESSDLTPFNQGTFYKPALTESYSLSDAAYRKLILLKAASNISSTSLASLNALLRNLFEGRGDCWVIESGVMTLRYIFSFYLTPAEAALMRRQDLPPKPAGVGYQIYQINVASTFGFDGSGFQSFNNANFDYKGVENGYTY